VAGPSARLAYVTNGDAFSESAINALKTLKTDTNEVIVSAHFEACNETRVGLCKAAGVPLEVWTVNSADELLALDPYISGVISDNIHAGFVMYKAAMMK
jgi:hypothetical protein